MSVKNEKNSLLNHISALGLVIYDTKLYINTHPECTEAREYLVARKQEYEEAVLQFEAKYGPITHYAHPKEDIKWAWQIDSTRVGG